MSKLHCWIILGGEGVRKGSLIRALTGISRNKHCDIMQANGQSLRFWAAVRSVNEAADDEILRPATWVQNCTPPAPPRNVNITYARTNVLAAFRLDLGRAGYEPEDYLSALATSDSHIESIITLGETTRDWVRDFGAPYAHIAEPNLPTNLLARKVSDFWGWA